jgi:hypothetical protein
MNQSSMTVILSWAMAGAVISVKARGARIFFKGEAPI